MDINQRIKKIIDHFGFEQKDFAKKIGVTPSTISVTVNGLSPAGAKVILNILNEMPEISCEWLIRGNGEMLIKKNESNSNEAIDKEQLITYSQFEDLQNEIEKLKKDIGKLKKGN